MKIIIYFVWVIHTYVNCMFDNFIPCFRHLYLYLHVLGILALAVLPVLLPPAKCATRSEKSGAVSSNGVVLAQQ
jgi:hypothetical protein